MTVQNYSHDWSDMIFITVVEERKKSRFASLFFNYFNNVFHLTFEIATFKILKFLAQQQTKLMKKDPLRSGVANLGDARGLK